MVLVIVGFDSLPPRIVIIFFIIIIRSFNIAAPIPSRDGRKARGYE